MVNAEARAHLAVLEYIGILGLLTNINNNIVQANNNIANLTTTVNNNMVAIQETLEKNERWNLARLANKSAGPNVQLHPLEVITNHGPPIVWGVPPNFPATKSAIQALTAAHLTGLEAAYGYHVPPGANVQIRRVLLSNFIGDV